MKTTKKFLQKSVILGIGKVLTLCGVALTFAACYGVPEPPERYWENHPEFQGAAPSSSEPAAEAPEVAADAEEAK